MDTENNTSENLTLLIQKRFDELGYAKIETRKFVIFTKQLINKSYQEKP